MRNWPSESDKGGVPGGPTQTPHNCRYGAPGASATGVPVGYGGVPGSGSAPVLGLPEQWLMHDGSGDTFADATPNANTITATDITWGTGTGVTSPTFNGSTSTAVAAQIPITDFDGTKPFWVSVWVNASTSGDSTVVGTLVPGSSYQGWELSLFPLQLYLINAYPGNLIQVHAPDITTGTAFNIIVAYDGSQTAAGVSIYEDGVQQTISIVEDTLSASTASGIPIHVGSRSDGTQPFAGSMSNLQIFSGTPTAGQIAAIQTVGP